MLWNRTVKKYGNRKKLSVSKLASLICRRGIMSQFQNTVFKNEMNPK
ncbi:hypothetical protein T03_2462 [Trichinella britovi]|uniref:HTH psq-type domain-containing protein n=1 Tax=Trichinella britovi TaxID=45882 RepID=A0A0V1BSL2_TRIBR|nr:hypothetical protein T03_2462 [Trichinella britovi]